MAYSLLVRRHDRAGRQRSFGRRLQAEMEEPGERQDQQLQHIAKAHIVEHERQKLQKMMLQNLAARAMAAMNAQGVPSIAPSPMGAPIQGPQGAPAPGGVAPPPLAPAPEAPLPTGPVMPPNQ
jgi:hypothetical protein